MASRAEVERRDQQMQAKSCYRLCGSCGGCRNYSGAYAQCGRCAPEYRRCSCRDGIRRWLGDDGLIKIKRFGDHDKSGTRFDLGPVFSGPAAAAPAENR
ncbi:MAG: hypothetical protein ACK47B_23850 [Armatimonadota bacterium]